MSALTNRVISGAYNGRLIETRFGKRPYIAAGLKKIDLNSSTVRHYEIIGENQRISGTSAVGKAAVGAAIVGPVGLLAGAGAKKKTTRMISVYFKDGQSCVIQLDDQFFPIVMNELSRVGLDYDRTPAPDKQVQIQMNPKMQAKIGPVSYSQPGRTQQPVQQHEPAIEYPHEEIPFQREIDEGLHRINENLGRSQTSALSEQAEAIRKFKELLDMGAITQEEFDAKKKQILGL